MAKKTIFRPGWLIDNPSILQFRIPALTAGDYRLEITTQYSNDSVQTKEPRTLYFAKVQNVPAAEPTS